MKRMILSTAATGLGLIGLGLSTPALAQDAPEVSEELTLEACSDIQPPCMTEEGTVLLKDGRIVSAVEAYEALGIAAPREEVETGADTSPETEPTTAGEEAVADIEHQEVVEEDILADQLAEDMAAEESPAEGTTNQIEETDEVAPDATVTQESDTDVTAEPLNEESADVPPASDAVMTEEEESSSAREEAVEAQEAVEELQTDVTVAPVEEAAEAASDDINQADPMTENPVAGEMTDAEVKPQLPEEVEGFVPTTAGEARAVEMTEEALKAEAEAEAEIAAQEDANTTAAAAASAETGQEVEVQTETVTAETARSSDEEFSKQTTVQPEKDEDGLSNLEKFLIGAVGAAVIGNVLSDDDQVVANTGDRVIVERDGQLRVLKNDDALLRQPGSQVTTETFTDGSTRTTLNREDGTEVVTIRSADGRVLRRERVLADGRRVVLFDDTQTIEAVDVSALPAPTQKTVTYTQDEDALRAALAASQAETEVLNRRFSLSQIRSIRAVRELAPEIELTNVNFATGSAAISPTEAEELAALGRAMRDAIAANPREVFLVEGHTDAVGAATMNLALSDRRAESLALALTEYFDVPPENMVVQGYGERYLKVPTVEAERANRRAAVRVITPLLAEAAAQ
ncbi:OmpA family protein [Celeribacter persicus]|uniref:Outer membrane protein OmpA-like peptidoglycan-associated protein n=1 Tax=Celeribacter persicus TaxID=1651082 RepID=A0A2T5HWL1_9RHOB|nr:OmpA family protein [Celeribacter persicus]PTQ75966.1 outer membrane protein OmpA-like peptidoglycan-associated protein [Celeribacter persicus]